jgi:hypothetical protein
MAIYLVNLDGYESAQEAVDPSEAIRLARCESGMQHVVCQTCTEYDSLDDIPVKATKPEVVEEEDELLAD